MTRTYGIYVSRVIGSSQYVLAIFSWKIRNLLHLNSCAIFFFNLGFMSLLLLEDLLMGWMASDTGRIGRTNIRFPIGNLMGALLGWPSCIYNRLWSAEAQELYFLLVLSKSLGEYGSDGSNVKNNQ